MSMPLQKPGKSRQDYRTPYDILDAVEERFGELTWDLAADAVNTVVPGRFYSATNSAFDADWATSFTRRDLLWLNPPFGGIAHAWAPLVWRWCSEHPWLRVVMLTPASIGSEWFRRYAHGKAMVLGLNPRLTFRGESDPYPKDCMLSCYGFGLSGFDIWRYDGKPERRSAAPPARLQSVAPNAA